MATVPKEVSRYLARIGAKGGKVGGKSTTKRKADAARANGHKGGRPLKQRYCSGCEASLTSADLAAKECTQCHTAL